MPLEKDGKINSQSCGLDTNRKTSSLFNIAIVEKKALSPPSNFIPMASENK